MVCSSRRAPVRDEFDPPEFDEDREQNRDDFTIFVHQIHPKVDDRDLFDFFSHVGRVLDIRLIRDQRTLKSKGSVVFHVHASFFIRFISQFGLH